MGWRGCLILGYTGAVFALIVPAAANGKPMLGVVCLAFSFMFLFSGDSVIASLTGIANLWLMMSWFCLLFPAKELRVASGLFGYGCFLIALLSQQEVSAVYIGYYLWCVSFLLVATGTLLSAHTPKGDEQ